MDDIALADRQMRQSLKSYKPFTSDISFEIPLSTNLPSWLSGSLYRIGPGIFEVPYSVPISDEEKETHWFSFTHLFDSLPLIQQFSFDGESMRYMNAPTGKGMERKINTRHGLPPWLPTFNSWSNQSFLSHFSKSFSYDSMKQARRPDVLINGASLYTGIPMPPELSSLYGPDAVNTNRSTVRTPLLVALPFLGPPVLQYIDANTLDPVAAVSLAKLNHEIEGNFLSPLLAQSAANEWLGCTTHYHYGYFGGNCTYTVFSISSGEDGFIKCDVIGKVNTSISKGGLALNVGFTSQFVILPIYPYVPTFSGGIKVANNAAPVMESFYFDSSRPIQFHIISRATNNHVGTYESLPGAFGFHVVNAWELREGTSISIVVDTVVYDDASILDHLKLENLRSDSESTSKLPKSYIKRFTLKNVDQVQEKSSKKGTPQITRDVASVDIADVCIQQPVINPKFHGSSNRYVFGMGRSHAGVAKLRFWDSIIKIDVSRKQTVAEWSQKGVFVSDVAFVPSPTVPSEDEGIIIFQFLDTKGSEKQFSKGGAAPFSVSGIIILDAKSLSMISRLELPIQIRTTVNSVLSGPQEVDLMLPTPPLSFGKCIWLPQERTKGKERARDEPSGEEDVTESSRREEGNDDPFGRVRKAFKDPIPQSPTLSIDDTGETPITKENLRNIPPEELFRNNI